MNSALVSDRLQQVAVTVYPAAEPTYFVFHATAPGDARESADAKINQSGNVSRVGKLAADFCLTERARTGFFSSDAGAVLDLAQVVGVICVP